MATVLLVRHGESTWNRRDRIQGWAATTLTDRGRRQSRALATHLTDRHAIDRVLASDLQRAQETARAVATAAGVDPEFDPAWRERDFGNLQGLSSATLFERYPQHSLSDAGYAAAAERPPGGESLLDARERVLDAWRRLRAALAAGETAVVVTHGGPLYLLLGFLRGEDVVEAVLDRSQDNCAVNELRIGEGDDGASPAGDTGSAGAVDGGGPDDLAGSDAVGAGDVRVVRGNETGFLD